MYFELYMGSDIRDYFFNLRSRDQTVLLRSESYNSHSAALDDIEKVRKATKDKKNFMKNSDHEGRAWFSVQGTDGDTLATSPLFDRLPDMDRIIEKIIKEAAQANLKDRTVAHD